MFKKCIFGLIAFSLVLATEIQPVVYDFSSSLYGEKLVRSERRARFESFLESTDTLIRAVMEGQLDELVREVTIEPYLPSTKFSKLRGKVQTLDWKKIIKNLMNERLCIGSLNCLEHIVQTIRNVDEIADRFVREHLILKADEAKFRRHLRLIMLFHDIGKAACEKHNTIAHEHNSYLMSQQILHHLGYSPAEVVYYLFFIKFHGAMGVLSTQELYPDFCAHADEFINLFENIHDVTLLTAVNLCDIKERPWIGDEWNVSLIQQEGELIKEIRGFKSVDDPRRSREKLEILMENHRAMARLLERMRKCCKNIPMEKVRQIQKDMYNEMFLLLKKDLTTKLTEENFKFLEWKFLTTTCGN